MPLAQMKAIRKKEKAMQTLLRYALVLLAINNSLKYDKTIQLSLAKHSKLHNSNENIRSKLCEFDEHQEAESKTKSKRYKLPNLKKLKIKFSRKIRKEIINFDQKQVKSVSSLKHSSKIFEFCQTKPKLKNLHQYNKFESNTRELKECSSLKIQCRENKKDLDFAYKINQTYDNDNHFYRDQSDSLKILDTNSPSISYISSNNNLKDKISNKNKKISIKSNILSRLFFINNSKKSASVSTKQKSVSSCSQDKMNLKQESFIKTHLLEMIDFEGFRKLKEQHNKIADNYCKLKIKDSF